MADSNSNSSDLDNLGKGLGNANFLNGLDNLSKMQPSDDSDSDSDSDDDDSDVDPVKLAAEKAMEGDSFNPSQASAEQDDNKSSASASSSSSASSSVNSSSSNSSSSSSSSNSNSSSSSNSNSSSSSSSSSSSADENKSSSDVSNNSSVTSESESQTPAQANASNEVSQVLAERAKKEKKSEIAEELQNNDVTNDEQDNKSTSNSVVKEAENVAQQNLDANKLPDEAVQELDSPNTELNKARVAHNGFIRILKRVHKNNGKLTNKDFTQIIKYANDSFNNLCKSLNKSQRQGDYRLQQIESNLQNAKQKADKGADVLKLWEKEGLFANVSKNVAVLDQVINDPRFQTFVKTNKLNNTRLEQPTLLAKKGAQARATLKRLGTNDQHKK